VRPVRQHGCPHQYGNPHHPRVRGRHAHHPNFVLASPLPGSSFLLHLSRRVLRYHQGDNDDSPPKMGQGTAVVVPPGLEGIDHDRQAPAWVERDRVGAVPSRQVIVKNPNRHRRCQAAPGRRRFRWTLKEAGETRARLRSSRTIGMRPASTRTMTSKRGDVVLVRTPTPICSRSRSAPPWLSKTKGWRPDPLSASWRPSRRIFGASDQRA